MCDGKTKYILTLIAFFVLPMCRKAYTPPAIKSSNHFLAVDGFINTGANAVSSFTLSRSLNLLDTLTNLPERHAEVMIVGADGSSFPLTDTASNGIYTSNLLTLNVNQKYQLSIVTNDGSKYESDLVSSKIAPPIDSISWQLAYDDVEGAPAVNIFVNAHDETNNTRYYRWDFSETWEHQAFYNTDWILKGDTVRPRGPGESSFTCWSNEHSANILLGTSIALNADIISQAPVAKILKDDPRLDIKYSILVRQYPLDQESYKYWITVQKNSQSLGGLFDLQPSQIKGNIHGVSNPNDPVFGYVSASSVQEKRIFIENPTGWQSNPIKNCPMVTAPINLNTLYYNYPDTSFAVYHFVTTPPSMVLTQKACLDCTYQGGSTTQPPFWQ